MRFAGCDDGGAEEARGRGSSNAGLGRSLGVRVDSEESVLHGNTCHGI